MAVPKPTAGNTFLAVACTSAAAVLAASLTSQASQYFFDAELRELPDATISTQIAVVALALIIGSSSLAISTVAFSAVAAK